MRRKVKSTQTTKIPAKDQAPPATGIYKHRQLRKRHYLFFIGLLLAVFTSFLLFSHFNSHKATVPGNSGSTVHIKVANIGEYSIFNLIAKDKGLFEKHGLQADVKEYASGPPAVADLLTGKADFAVAADFVGVNNIFSHKDLRILSEASYHYTFRVLGRKDKGIASPTDLKGKRVGVTRKSAAEFFLGTFLTLNNMNLKDITIVDLTPDAMIDGLTNGQIDAIVTFEPHAYDLQKNLGDKIVSWSAQGSQKTHALIYTTQAFIQANPGIADRYLAALVDAETLLNQNESAMRTYLASALHYGSDYVDYLWLKFNFRIWLSQELLLTMEDQARWAIENKLTDQTTVPNYLDFIYFDSLQKIKPAAINIIH